jgi:DNA gyrase subunit A
MGRGAAGVKGLTLKRDDLVVDMIVIRPGMGVLTVCENGFGKRTDIDEYRLQKRGGSGVINIRATERNGVVVALKAVRDEDELMLITATGIMLRTAVSQTREIGRATQGVKLIRVDEGDRVVSVARIAKEDDVGGDESGEGADVESRRRPPGEEGKPETQEAESAGMASAEAGSSEVSSDEHPPGVDDQPGDGPQSGSGEKPSAEE